MAAAPKSGKRGRQQSFSDAAIQACLTLKVLFGMPLRQTVGFVQSLLRLIWRKIHIGVDKETLQVRAVAGERAKATHAREPANTRNTGDAPMLPELLNQVPPDQNIGSVTADGAYGTRKCHDTIIACGAHAVIPPRKNSKSWKPTSAGAIAQNEAIKAPRYLDRAIWRWRSGYHRRSCVETKMHCVKLLGQSLMAWDFVRQVGEIQIRVSVLNKYKTLGTPVTGVVG